jgi:hypothetical protein
LSSTGIEPNSSRVSGTSAMPRITRSSSGTSASGAPSNTMRPRARNRPINALSSVDLPAPLGPITLTTLPRGTCSARPDSTSALP